MKKLQLAFLAIVAALLSVLATPVAAQYRMDCLGRDAYRCAVQNLRSDVTQHTRELARNIRSGRYNDYYRYDRFDDYNRRSGLGLTLRFGGGDGRETPGKCVERMTKAARKSTKEVDPALLTTIIAGCTGTNIPAPPQTTTTRTQPTVPAAQTQVSVSGVEVSDTEFYNNSDHAIIIYVNKKVVGKLNAKKQASFARISQLAGEPANRNNTQYCHEGQVCQTN